MFSRRRLREFLVAFLMISFRCYAQSSPNATISGTATDESGAVVPGVVVTVVNPDTGLSRKATTERDGYFSIPELPPGRYVMTASREGFTSVEINDIVLHVGDQTALSIRLKVGAVVQKITIHGSVPLLDTQSSSSGATVTSQQIEQIPINGRNYLDLLQLVPGVAVNRQVDPTHDSATPILGERGGNAVFLIDGLPNQDQVDSGPSAQFNQDSVFEFQVLTGGYRAEFGHGSGGIINVVSKSGTDQWHGGASFFQRNYKLDSSDVPGKETPFLLRWDPSVQIGGPIIKDKMFFFVSAERILESRELNFQFPANTPPTLLQSEIPFNKHSMTFDTRVRGKFDEQFGRHHLSEQVNLTNSHLTDYLPLTLAFNLPSTRNNFDNRRLMLGLNDTTALGDWASPFLISFYAQYRGDPSRVSPAHPSAGFSATSASLFSNYDSGQLFGDLGFAGFGPGHDASILDGNYASLGTNISHQVGRHTLKFGWDFQRTHVSGAEANVFFNQSFITAADFAQFGPVDAGTYFLIENGGLTPQDNNIRLRNNYNGTFLQDDWRVGKNLMLNLGMRWDYDSRFPNKTNFSPRLGFAWSITPKTVLRANWGIFYDHFRLGLARDIPAFGGANIVNTAFLSFPRLFYGNPSTLTELFASFLNPPIPCVSSNMTDAQIAASGLKCSANDPTGNPLPLYGIDHLNGVVAPGHAPVPANTVVNIGNVQSLTGLTPQQFLDAASVAVGDAVGALQFDPFGRLSFGVSAFPPSTIPITVDPSFRTPYTNEFHIGLQRELRSNMSIQIDAYHKNIDHILGNRISNLAFEARLPGHTHELVPGTGDSKIDSFGPWFHGTYDGMTLGLKKRMGNRFTLEANYTYAHEIDNLLFESLISDMQTTVVTGGPGLATDSFIGIPPVVTDPATGQTNAHGPFVASNGNPVPRAGVFYNGPNLDKGRSALAPDHTFVMHGLVELPWKVKFSSIFRVQSGFAFSSASPAGEPDVDGSGNPATYDFTKGRNRFTAPAFVNWDTRVAKQFDFGERVRLHAYIEFFNLLNRANPAAINGIPPTSATQPLFGEVLQVLPGREGQVGVRIEF